MNASRFIFRTATNRDIPKIVDLVKRSLTEFDSNYSPKTSENDLLDIEQTYLKNSGIFKPSIG
ncbi:hypothetical protein ACS386_05685 [Flavobacteriaceae bacterium LMO-SS05]